MAPTTLAPTGTPTGSPTNKQECGPAMLLDNGVVAPSSGLVYNGFAVAFACDEGYLLQGPASVACRIVDGEAQWNDTAPECLRNNCDDPPAITNGTTTATGLVVQIACDYGFSLTPSDTTNITCENGEWK